MLNLKIFREVLSPLHGYYKQDAENKFDPNLEKSVA